MSTIYFSVLTTPWGEAADVSPITLELVLVSYSRAREGSRLAA